MITQKHHEPSSLDRFIWSKSFSLWGYTNVSTSVIWKLIVGGTLMLSGAGLLIGWYFSGLLGLLIGGGCGAFVGSLFLAWGVYQKGVDDQNRPQHNVKLSGDAISLIHSLANHIGWTDPNSNYGSMYKTSYVVFGISLGEPKTASQKLQSSTFGLLERAAAHYNHISGLMKTRDDKSAIILQQYEPAILAAADEAMIIVLNQAAIMEKHPESVADYRSSIETKIRELEELSLRVRKLAQSQRTFTESMGTNTVMNSVLEQLRIEEAARQELALDADDELRRHLRQDS